MNSLRELTRSFGKPCSLRNWAIARKIPLDIPSEKPFTLSLRQIMDAYAPPSLWGFADLHAHPASHLAFGASVEGTNGPLYGNPSCLPLEAAIQNMEHDLAPCDGRQHSPSGFDIDPAKADMDPVRVFYRWYILNTIEKNWTHNPSGWPNCDYWPNASSKAHQQMHISSIYRAWQGGLRLMIASVTDNQLIARLMESFDVLRPLPRPGS